jgi:hypothetical protein
MSDIETSGGINATIQGDHDGQFAVGNHVVQIGRIDGQQVVVGTGNTQTVVATRPAVTEADLAALRQAFADLKQLIAAQAAPDKKDSALERIDELEEACAMDKPDVGAIGYVKRWFARNLPQLAGAVTGVIIHPIVGKLVAAAGDALAAEFRRVIGQE